MVKVLIVEDEENFAQTLEFGLSDFGFEVKLASNGAEGLNVIETDRPDIRQPQARPSGAALQLVHLRGAGPASHLRP